MVLTWPLKVASPPVNIAFGEPTMMLGILLIIAGFAINSDKLIAVLPASIITFVVGLVLASIGSSILSYNLIGDALPEEPITGQFTGWQNVSFGLIYLLVALGCLLAPWSTSVKLINQVVYWAWLISGIFFILYSVINYRSHIGYLINITRGTSYRW
jgi:uncharacterized membrane protein